MKKQAQLKLIDRTKLQTYLEDEIPVKVICKGLGVSKKLSASPIGYFYFNTNIFLALST